MVFLYNKIPWKPAYPGDLTAQGHYEPKENKNTTHEDERFSH